MFNMFARSETSILQKRGYLLGDDLGEGSYAKVKSATWKRPAGNVKVALKIIDIPQIPKDFKEKFLPRELEIIKILNHKNVIKTMEIFSGGKKTYISLEFAGHGDMLSYIQLRGALREQDSVKLFKQIANGLQYLHRNGVVHRDLKCENILLSNQDVIKIADFGFARKMTTNDLSMTFCGSAAYAPPEILQGVPYVGTVADVWSIGVILFVMNCAIMPFRDGSIRTLLLDQRMPLRYSPKLEKKISTEAKSMMKSLLTYNASVRPSLGMILQHEWLKKDFENGAKAKSSSQIAEHSPEATLTIEQGKLESEVKVEAT